jgi:hypothetical protein
VRAEASYAWLSAPGLGLGGSGRHKRSGLRWV